MKNPTLNIIVALQAEAQPVIDFYNLKKITNGVLPFNIFVNKAETIHLLISGVGKIKMATATAFLSAWLKNQTYMGYFNYGIAGSTQFTQGSFVLINKIIENTTNRKWYPFTSPLKKKQQTQLITFDSPCVNYPACGVIDMEGSAFFQAASYFASQEYVQIAKIVSDSSDASQKVINEKSVKMLIKGQLPQIVDVIDYLMALIQDERSALETDIINLDQFKQAWHFSQAQLIQLKESLRRFRALNPHENVWEYCKTEKFASAVLKKLINKLDSYAHCIY